MTEQYRGWDIHPAYIGHSATHDNYEAWTEGEGEWTDSGLSIHGMTVAEIKAEIDLKVEEMEDGR